MANAITEDAPTLLQSFVKLPNEIKRIIALYFNINEIEELNLTCPEIKELINYKIASAQELLNNTIAASEIAVLGNGQYWVSDETDWFLENTLNKIPLKNFPMSVTNFIVISNFQFFLTPEFFRNLSIDELMTLRNVFFISLYDELEPPAVLLEKDTTASNSLKNSLITYTLRHCASTEDKILYFAHLND